MGSLEVAIAYKRGPKSDRGVYLEFDREAHGFAIYGDELTLHGLFHRTLSTMMSPAYTERRLLSIRITSHMFMDVAVLNPDRPKQPLELLRKVSGSPMPLY